MIRTELYLHGLLWLRVLLILQFDLETVNGIKTNYLNLFLDLMAEHSKTGLIFTHLKFKQDCRSEPKRKYASV